MARVREEFHLKPLLSIALWFAPAAFAAGPIADIYDADIRRIEREVLGLAQRMPADKYDYAPTNGSFQGVRTFGLQVRHIATEMYMRSASVLDEAPPVDIGTTDDGPDSLQTKDQILAYFQGAIAYAHKAMQSLTAQNLLDSVRSPNPNARTTRLAAAQFIGWHSYDHYGQMVVYARANGVIPGGPAPAGAKGKGAPGK
jgi:hypothetical protein